MFQREDYKQGPYSKPYQPIRIDPPAIVGNIDKEIIPHYREILKRAKAGGYKIEPIKHRKDVPKSLNLKKNGYKIPGFSLACAIKPVCLLPYKKAA